MKRELFNTNLLEVIDLIIEEREKSIQNRQQNVGNQGDTRESLHGIIVNELTALNPDVTAFWFLELLIRLKSVGTFYDYDEAEALRKDFKAYKIEIPESVKNCFKEIETRTKYVYRVIKDKGEISAGQKEVLSNKIIGDIEAYATPDRQSVVAYLNTLLQGTVAEIKHQEKSTVEKYGFHIDGLWEGENFLFTEEQLNSYFFTGEARYHSANKFGELSLNLIYYFEKIAKIRLIKQLIVDYDQGTPIAVIPLTGKQRFILDYTKITAIYALFERDGYFEDPFSLQDFLNCFDLSIESPKHPRLKRGFQIKFIYILSCIKKGDYLKEGADSIAVEKLVLDRFGIKGYYTNLEKAKPSVGLKSDISKSLA